MRLPSVTLGPAILLAVIACRPAERPDPWQEARRRGIDFRAVGQEPGWLLEIDHEGSLRLAYDYAQRSVTAPTPAPATTSATTTYRATPDGHDLSVVIERRPCQDVMSGEPFPASVSVTIDGRTLHGCGR